MHWSVVKQREIVQSARSALDSVCFRRFSTSPTYLLVTRSVPYTVPQWCQERLLNTPKHGRLQIANLPTPVYRIFSPLARNPFLQAVQDLNIQLLIKRDDATGGVELGGNKVRKLEFLMADAVANGHDSVITIGGIQSNHCRATATLSRMCGLQPHLILRTGSSSTNNNVDDVGYVGNLLVDRMVGATVYTCTPDEYARAGQTQLLETVSKRLKSDSHNPYVIPVGGSTSVGTWGYINAVDELLTQLDEFEQEEKVQLDHIVFACGSGGTAAGISLGIALAHESGKLRSRHPPQVHAMGVCDDPNYFYDYVAHIAKDMGLVVTAATSNVSAAACSFQAIKEYIRAAMIVHQARGIGYAKSTTEELEFVATFAQETGIVLDPVYTGKALYKFYCSVLKKNPEDYRNKTILFWHSGGTLGLYDKIDKLDSMLKQDSPCYKLDFH